MKLYDEENLVPIGIEDALTVFWRRMQTAAGFGHLLLEASHRKTPIPDDTILGLAHLLQDLEGEYGEVFRAVIHRANIDAAERRSGGFPHASETVPRVLQGALDSAEIVALVAHLGAELAAAQRRVRGLRRQLGLGDEGEPNA